MTTSDNNNSNKDLYTQNEAEGILNEWQFYTDNHEEWANQYNDRELAQEVLLQKIKRIPLFHQTLTSIPIS